MPPKKTPGVYVEETSSPPPPIQGVSTTTTAFVGPTRKGPIATRPALLTSFADFERIYGGSNDLLFAPSLNYISHAVRAFFAEGGTRLYVARVAHKARAPAMAPTLEDYQKAFTLLSGLPDISIVAAPGHTAFPPAIATGVAQQLIAHAEQLNYRFAVLDTPPGQSPADAESYRASFNSKLAALYYPWVVVPNPRFKPANPASTPEITLPPSAFVCGIYVRTDTTLGVWKAPANQAVKSALRLERTLTNADQGPLNDLGINCLRSFGGQGNLVWGARTISSDMEWKYVPVARYFIYLEHSIDLGTQWAAVEPNAEPLWAKIRLGVATFLMNEWRRGTMQGAQPKDSFYVRCDATTMTQNDLDNGRLVCEIGIAPTRPAEFVILRIGQKTAGATA